MEGLQGSPALCPTGDVRRGWVGATGRGFGSRPRGRVLYLLFGPSLCSHTSRKVCAPCFPSLRAARSSPPWMYLSWRHCVTLPTEGAAAAQARPLPLRSPPSSPLASPLRLGGPLPFSAGSLSPPASYTLGPLFPLRRLLSGPLIPMTQSLPPI